MVPVTFPLQICRENQPLGCQPRSSLLGTIGLSGNVREGPASSWFYRIFLKRIADCNPGSLARNDRHTITFDGGFDGSGEPFGAGVIMALNHIQITNAKRRDKAYKLADSDGGAYRVCRLAHETSARRSLPANSHYDRLIAQKQTVGCGPLPADIHPGEAESSEVFTQSISVIGRCSIGS